MILFINLAGLMPQNKEGRELSRPSFACIAAVGLQNNATDNTHQDCSIHSVYRSLHNPGDMYEFGAIVWNRKRFDVIFLLQTLTSAGVSFKGPGAAFRGLWGAVGRRWGSRP